MRNKMNGKTLVASAAFFCLGILMTSLAFATTITDQNSGLAGLQFTYNLNNGAFITNNESASNLFNANDLINIQGDTTAETNDGSSNKVGEPFALSAIPYMNIVGIDYFQFIFDMQETGQGHPLTLDSVSFRVGVTYVPKQGNTPGYVTGGTVVWTLAEPILFNTTLPHTNTPQGAGGDSALYVPLSLFQGLGLTGSSLVTMTVLESLGDNGDDEWVALTGGNYFGPNDPIDPNIPPQAVVPEPSTVVLLGSGLLGLIYVGRSRRRK